MTIGYYLVDAWSSTESTGNRSETYRLCCWVPLSLSPQQGRSLNKRKPQVILGIAKTSSLSSSKSPVSLTSINGRAPGYRLSPYHFQTVSRMLTPDWAQKRLYIILPNRQTASWVLFVCSYTTATFSPYLSGSFIKVVHARETFIFYSPNQKRRNYRWVGKHFGCYQQERSSPANRQ